MDLKLKPIFLLIPILLFSHMATAQSQVRVHADVQQILIGDPVTVTVDVQPATAEGRVKFPTLPKELKGLEVLDTVNLDTIHNQHLIYRQQYRLTGYDSGSFYVPSFRIEVIGVGNRQEILYTDSLLVQVQTIAVDTALAFKPIKDIIPIATSWLDYWQLLLALLVLLGLIVLVVYYFYKNRGVKIPDAPVRTPPEKAHEKALRLLQELKDKQYGQQGKVKLYYSSLSDIIRNYIDDRFGMNCMEQTTDELMALLKKQMEDRTALRKVRPDLKKLLQTADLVKFAKADPGVMEHERCWDAAVKVITVTQIRPEEGLKR